MFNLSKDSPRCRYYKYIYHTNVYREVKTFTVGSFCYEDYGNTYYGYPGRLYLYDRRTNILFFWDSCHDTGNMQGTGGLKDLNQMIKYDMVKEITEEEFSIERTMQELIS